MKQPKKHYIKESHMIYESLAAYTNPKMLDEYFEEWCNLSDYVRDGDNARDEYGNLVMTKEDYIEVFNDEELYLFGDWITYCENPYDFFVTGQLGLWDCKPIIVPKMFHTLKEAIQACANGMDYIEVELCPKCIKFKGIHHDGANHFEIRMMNKRAQNMYDNAPCDMDDEVLRKIAANEKYHHTLFDEMFACWL